MKLCYHCMTQIENEHAHSCPKCLKSLKTERVSPKYLQPGTVLRGRFIVGHPLGAGGFGNTYIGWNNVLLRKVAIKEFFPEQYATRMADGLNVTVKEQQQSQRFQNGLRRFLEEARSVAALQDIKGVVAISQFFEENGTGYIIMEYLEGMDVRTILEKSGNKKDYEWCRRVILTILHTLREIHRRGVLHRDIAPDNIFVTNEGVIKLIDFGAAKHSDVLEPANAEIMLKVGYSPIEQYSRRTAQGAYTDIYAVAAVFYRMLTGQKPFPANERVRDDELITPSEMGIAIPKQAELGIMVSLNVRPEYRLQSADEFMEALDGKDFVPVYEPEWILPPVREKKSFAKLPFAAKISIGFLVLCLVAGVAAVTVITVSKNVNNREHLSGGDSIVIADYSGQSVEEVVPVLEEELGITNVELVYELSDSGVDTVIRQNPQPGEITEDTKVTLYVSGGDDLYTLNDFTGKDKEEIISWFSRYNFDVYANEYPDAVLNSAESLTNDEYKKQSGKIAMNYEYSEDFEKDICFEQSIDSGVVCSGADDVVFTVSAGKLSDYEIAIPDLTGMDLPAAENALEEAGLAEYLDMICQDAEENEIDTGDVIVLSQSSGADSVYNTLEKKIYRYIDGARKDVEESTTLYVVVELKKKNSDAEKVVNDAEAVVNDANAVVNDAQAVENHSDAFEFGGDAFDDDAFDADF